MPRCHIALALVAAFTCLTASRVTAQEAPKRTVDMTVVLKDDHGHAIPDQFQKRAGDDTCERCPSLTLGLAVYNALMFMPPPSRPGEPELSWEKKYSRGTLAMRLKDNASASLDAKTTTDVLALLGVVYPPYLMAVMVPMLDPNAKTGDLR